EAMRDRYGSEALDDHFRAFDTICSATQERQDAVISLLESEPLDLMLVIGGYNSSNTCNLARLCAASVPTYHIADVDGLVDADRIRHRPVPPPDAPPGPVSEIVSHGWLPGGRVRIGLTAGASTPNNIVGQAIARLAAFAEAGQAALHG